MGSARRLVRRMGENQMKDEIITATIRKLTPKPGDIIVIETANHLTTTQYKRVLRQFKAAFKDTGIKAILLEEGLTIPVQIEGIEK